MTTRTFDDLICDNQTETDERIAAEKAEFAAIAKIGQAWEARHSGGQLGWVVIQPATALTAAQRRRLQETGWRFGRNWKVGENTLGFRGQDYEVVSGWAK